MRLWTSFAVWFERYVWRFKIGKAGTGLVALGALLDLYHRGETLYKWITEIPAVIEILHAWWIDPAIIVCGLGLIWASNVKAKQHPPPKTPEQRLDEAETALVTARTTTALHQLIIEELQKSLESIGDARARLYAVVCSFPKHLVRESELTELIEDIWSCCIEYKDLQALYPAHPVSAKPFGTGWRPSRPEQELDEVTKHFERWATHLEIYANRLNNFRERWRFLPTDPEIIGWVKHWHVNRHDTDGPRVVSAMSLHATQLISQRDAYAADLEKAIGNASVTTS